MIKVFHRPATMERTRTWETRRTTFNNCSTTKTRPVRGRADHGSRPGPQTDMAAELYTTWQKNPAEDNLRNVFGLSLNSDT